MDWMEMDRVPLIQFLLETLSYRKSKQFFEKIFPTMSKNRLRNVQLDEFLKLSKTYGWPNIQ